MTIANTFASKLFVGTVAIAMALSLVAPAQAQTEAELQAQIDQLMATITALQAQAGQTTTGGSTAGVCPYAWTRSLSSGSTGADVMALQKFLNANTATQVAAAGSAGSAGMETEYYGPATAAAVSNFQVTYRDEILTPNGLVNPTGYFGPSSIAKANALCATAAPVDGDDDDSETPGESADLQGEGTLGTFEVDDEEDEVMEGAEDEVVMVITAEADDGDIEVDRMNFTLVGGSEETDPWDAFEEVSLWVDGDKVADFDASDEDAYLDEDDGEFRFSGLGLVLREDEETEIMVAVSVASSVDGADAGPSLEDWVLSVTDVRYFDADGVATDDDDTDELGDGETFTIDEEGADDEADLESSSANPDATTLLVDDGTADSDEYVVHIFDIEIGDDSSDLVLDDAFVDVTVVNPAGNEDTTVEDVIADIFVTIDGEKVDGEVADDDVNDDDDSTDNLEPDHVIAATESNTVTYRFEFDGLDLEAGETYEVEVSVVLEGQNTDDYENGVEISTDVDGSDWEVEGAADDNVLTGTDGSEDHTLANVVPVISDTSFNVDRNEDGDAGTISFEFTVEADGDENIDFAFGDVDDVDGATDDVLFSTTGGTATVTATIAKVSGDATANGSTGWTINDGDEATFVLDVNFTTDASGDNGTYRLVLESILGIEIDETSTGMSLTF